MSCSTRFHFSQPLFLFFALLFCCSLHTEHLLNAAACKICGRSVWRTLRILADVCKKNNLAYQRQTCNINKLIIKQKKIEISFNACSAICNWYIYPLPVHRCMAHIHTHTHRNAAEDNLLGSKKNMKTQSNLKQIAVKVQYGRKNANWRALSLTLAKLSTSSQMHRIRRQLLWRQIM